MLPFGGRLARFDNQSLQFRQIRPYPENQGGMPESGLRYRIQWNAPIVISPHDPTVLYHGSQYVHRSRNEGQSWEVISPDLTARDTANFGMAGGPITHDITGVETWSALLTIAESLLEPGEIWTGSNDGKVFLTRGDGGTWTDVTPPDLPFPSTVNRIAVSRHRRGTAYVAAYRYRLDDYLAPGRLVGSSQWTINRGENYWLDNALPLELNDQFHLRIRRTFRIQIVGKREHADARALSQYHASWLNPELLVVQREIWIIVRIVPFLVPVTKRCHFTRLILVVTRGSFVMH